MSMLGPSGLVRHMRNYLRPMPYSVRLPAMFCFIVEIAVLRQLGEQASFTLIPLAFRVSRCFRTNVAESWSARSNPQHDGLYNLQGNRVHRPWSLANARDSNWISVISSCGGC